MVTTTRIFNFSAGPAVLPLEVLEQAQRDLLALPGVGMSILEISHRSKPFEDILAGCEADLRTLANIPEGYHVLFLQGGASLQFSMVPMNLLPAGGSADYIVTGAWSQKAVKEAKRVGGVKIAASTEAENFTRVPRQSELKLDPGAAYVHYTTNNTIFGTEFDYVPDTAAVPLVADASSDIFSGPIDVSKFALIYAGAQKNLAPAGVDAGDRPRRHVEAHAVDDPDDAAVRRSRRKQVDVQHAAGVRDLRHAAGARMAAQARRSRGDRAAERAEGGKALRRDRSHGVLPRPRAEGQPLADERHVQAGDRRAGQEVCKGSDRGRAGRAQGAPLGRRYARVDLQRVPRGGGRRPRPVHAGVRAERMAKCQQSACSCGAHRSLTNRSRATCYCDGSLSLQESD